MICCICRQDKDSSAFHDKYHEAQPIMRKCLTCVTGYWYTEDRHKQHEDPSPRIFSPAYQQVILPGYKLCDICKKVLPLTRYALDSRCTGGFKRRCMNCDNWPIYWQHRHADSEWVSKLQAADVSNRDIVLAIETLKAEYKKDQEKV